jgi:hypothetical protein
MNPDRNLSESIPFIRLGFLPWAITGVWPGKEIIRRMEGISGDEGNAAGPFRGNLNA